MYKTRIRIGLYGYLASTLLGGFLQPVLPYSLEIGSAIALGFAFFGAHAAGQQASLEQQETN